MVTVDPKKWTHPPFGADRDGGYIYGRGTVDDKDNLVASLMLMLRLKRANTALDRDVIFLAESGEEGAPEVGAQFMIDNHLDAINAEFCLAEGGGVVRTGGKISRANVGTTEKEPRPIEIIARGPAGHGSVPSKNNAVTRLSAAVGKVASWVPPLRVNETTGTYFRKLAAMSPPDLAARYRDVLNPDPKVHGAGRRLAARQRAAALVDAAHLARAHHRRRGLSLQRDSLRNQGDDRCPPASGRGPERVPGHGAQGD